MIKDLAKKHITIIIGIAFGLAVIEVQYNLSLLTFYSFSCLLSNSSNKYLWQDKQKPGASEQHWMRSAQGPASPSISIGSGERITFLWNNNTKPIIYEWSFYWEIKIELIFHIVLSPRYLFSIENYSKSKVVLKLKVKAPNKSRTQPLHFLIFLPDFETENKNWNLKSVGSCFSAIPS